MTKNKPSVLSILPLLVFIAVFVGSGIYFNDFYALPSPLAALVGVVVAMLIYKSPLSEKINIFLTGCGDSKILMMCVIYLLAGAFAVVSKASGSVDAIVNLGIRYISVEYFPIGMFLTASFLSFSAGTSVGSIMALGPIAVDLATQSNSDMSLIGACLLSGAMFGDNLSLISDTTIASTQTMHCEMDEKMKANFKIALPAAILTIVILFFIGGSEHHTEITTTVKDFDVLLITPYVLVVALSLWGVNVFITLFLGLLLAGILGLAYEQFDTLQLLQKTYEGFTSMSEIFFLSLFIGGLAALVERFGGIRFFTNLIQKRISSTKTATLGIGALVSATNFCVANNTVSILISSKISKKIADKFGVAPRMAASTLDVFSCYVQGIVPYGAQILILIAFSNEKIQYADLFKYSVYLHLLLISTLLFIFFGKERELL